jgi:hypothetical protein
VVGVGGAVAVGKRERDDDRGSECVSERDVVDDGCERDADSRSDRESGRDSLGVCLEPVTDRSSDMVSCWVSVVVGELVGLGVDDLECDSEKDGVLEGVMVEVSQSSMNTCEEL